MTAAVQTMAGRLQNVVSYKLIKSLKAYLCVLTLRYTFSAVIFTYARRTVKRDPPFWPPFVADNSHRDFSLFNDKYYFFFQFLLFLPNQMCTGRRTQC